MEKTEPDVRYERDEIEDIAKMGIEVQTFVAISNGIEKKN